VDQYPRPHTPGQRLSTAASRERDGLSCLGWLVCFVDFLQRILTDEFRCCRPFIDVKYRVFALLAGRPGPDQHGHDSYAAVIAEATTLFSQQGINATGDGRRGPFTAVSAGKSYGGGQTVCHSRSRSHNLSTPNLAQRPGNLLNNRINQTICITMLTNWAIKRLAGFANGESSQVCSDTY
jgi:hypothetical protein